LFLNPDKQDKRVNEVIFCLKIAEMTPDLLNIGWSSP